MGEKLLAQRLIGLLRETNVRTSGTALALLDWARDQGAWLWPASEIAEAADGPAGGAEALTWERLPALVASIETSEAELPLFACIDSAAEILEFDAFEREVLRAAAALERLPRLASLRMRLAGSGEDMTAILGRLAGAEQASAASRVRRSGPVSLGLLVSANDPLGGGLDLTLDWRFARVLDEGLTEADRLTEALAGVRQPASLRPSDFAEHREPFRLLVRLLAGALARKAEGVNVLVYGPPGTGKTEFARTLAQAACASLFAVGEIDEDGEEPTRYQRLHALKRAQRLLARRGDSILLFDEMEDLFAEASIAAGGGRRSGSKIFVNRLLEGNKVPTIWTSNAIGEVDSAHLRRMSYILRMGYPNVEARARIVTRAAEAEGVAEAGAGLAPLLPQEEEAASVARVALRAAALAGGGAADAEAVGRSLLLGMRGGRVPPPAQCRAIDLDLCEADRPVAQLVEQIAAPGAPADVSLLLTGAPGTGKTALAALLAERLGRPLTVKRASDLLSSWVGETEGNIAAAFAEARERGSVLLFDEVDSLLLDRADAQRSWEVSQVNELLTWMDSHPLPFIAATNYPQRLDLAALRRFVFKVELRALSPETAERAYGRFFGTEAPTALRQVAGLTPGDFAVVARQLRYREAASSAEILSLLEAEVRLKPDRPMKVGF